VLCEHEDTHDELDALLRSASGGNDVGPMGG